VIPFVNRYKDNPYLWSIDICNEIEWVNQDAENGNIAWERLQYFVAHVAAAVHENSNVLVTLGSAAVKWNSPVPGCEGNFWSDENLKAQYNNPGAKLDFYSPHYYGWVVKWFGDFALNKSPASYQMNTKPCMVGECPAKGIFNDVTLEVPAKQMFLGAYNNGWCGLMPWTSNGKDTNGNLDDFDDGLLEFFKLYPQLVNPNIPAAIPSELSDKSRLLVKIYPNPSNNKSVRVLLVDTSDTFLQIADINGKILYHEKVKKNLTEINTTAFGKGVFIVSAKNNKVVEYQVLVLK
jgi:hypothetical protein